MIVADTSIWIDGFSAKASPRRETLRALIREKQIGMVRPVEAELFSGVFRPGMEDRVRRVFLALDRCDPDWSSREPWELAARYAADARSAGLRGIGLVDRLVLACCELKEGARLWTLDLGLGALASRKGLAVLPSR